MAKILIVDDDSDFVNATRMVLEKRGHSISSARNGTEGLERIRRDSPDLVILDVMMDSVLEGLSVSRKLHDEPAWCGIPIIMVTSIANTDYAELFTTDETVHIGSFLSKPVGPSDLIREVGRLVGAKDRHA
ncbi:MAG: response regulator [Acidobacteria bacterium]|nr:MAG: response regulator [Acidobacteriota bacterium]